MLTIGPTIKRPNWTKFPINIVLNEDDDEDAIGVEIKQTNVLQWLTCFIPTNGVPITVLTV